jgi:integrase
MNITTRLRGQLVEAPMIRTLGEMASSIAASAIPAARKRTMLWAVHRTIGIVGSGLHDVPADRKVVLRQLAQISPAMAGLSRQSFANLKSLMRGAFRRFGPDLAPARSRTRLGPEWAALEALLPVREQRGLSRMIRFAEAMGWRPHQIVEDHVGQLEYHLEHEALLDRPEGVIRATRHAWNRAADTVPGWPQQRLAAPPRKRTSYWLPLEQLPTSLQQEIHHHLHRLAVPDPFLADTCNGYTPATVEQFRHTFITLASALVASGTPVEDLTSVATLVRPDRLKQALQFLYRRGSNRITPTIDSVAWRARTIAPHAGLSEQDITELDKMVAKIRQQAPPRRGLTDKNRRLLEQLDDSAFADRLVTLPYRLIQIARKTGNQQQAASRARDAVAIELLLVCSVRVGNLVDLRVGETIRRFGKGHDARWVVELPPEKVKNRQPLRFPLPPESVQLIEEYLARWQSFWAGPGVPWLFPAKDGDHVNGRFLSESIARRARRHVGVRITCHQFRHLAAELYLREDPNGIGIVSQHLGHRDLNTTRGFYAREQTRIATQRYHEVLKRKRAAAPTRSRRRKPKGKPA